MSSPWNRPQRSVLELLFAEQIRTAGFVEPERDYRFHPIRKWAFDFAWPAPDDARADRLWMKTAVEVEGGTYVGGRHSRGGGYEEDCEKYAEALILGWRVLRVTGDMVNDGRAIELLRRLFRPDATPKTYTVIHSLYEHDCPMRCDSPYAVNCNCQGKCYLHEKAQKAYSAKREGE